VDKLTAKYLLAAHRNTPSDDGDPALEEALQLCRQNKEMRKWLEDEFAFDQRMSEILNSIKGPDEGARSILATAPLNERKTRGAPSNRRIRQGKWLSFLAVAAMAAVAALVGLGPFADLRGVAVSDAESVVDLAKNARNLDFASADVVSLNQWLAKRGAPVSENLTARLRFAEAIGCKLLTDNAGSEKISMICLEADGELVHLFLFDRESRLTRDLPNARWTMIDQYHVSSWQEGEMKIAVASRLPPTVIETELGGLGKTESSRNDGSGRLGAEEGALLSSLKSRGQPFAFCLHANTTPQT